ncbi:hypothetical protein [Alkaliphilus transvaalensis]|uniref:hypothetical protein n=1 Tax=Alkaliphilus transvaalensis TaxID=114628 RepID=UPI00047B7E82|nr:hypothetical protein [Alkaliphilus transvaalensis]
MKLKNDEEIENYNKLFNRRLLKSLGYTLLVVFISFYGIGSLLQMIFGGHPETSMILAVMITGIFVMFMCTFTILDQLKGR